MGLVSCVSRSTLAASFRPTRVAWLPSVRFAAPHPRPARLISAAKGRGRKRVGCATIRVEFQLLLAVKTTALHWRRTELLSCKTDRLSPCNRYQLPSLDGCHNRKPVNVTPAWQYQGAPTWDRFEWGQIVSCALPRVLGPSGTLRAG